MDNKKLMRIYAPKADFYLIIIFILLVIVAVLDWRVAVPLAVIFIAVLVQFFLQHVKKQKEILRHIENLTLNIDSATKETLLNFPMPLVVLEVDGVIAWYNPLFRGFLKNRDMLDKKIGLLIPELDVEELTKSRSAISLRVNFKDKIYNVLGNYVQVDEKQGMEKYLILLYFIDITEFEELLVRYENQQICAAIIDIDNYDELMQGLEESNRAQVLAEIDKRVAAWADFCKGILKKFERDKYLFIFEYQYLKALNERKFDILDTIKEINLSNKIPVTLSLGLGLKGKTLAENTAFAMASLDLALGRGGDQAVIKDGDVFSFFGGRTRALEKRTKVRARVVANAIVDLLEQADNVIIMGHSNPDVDFLGAAMGVFRISRSYAKKCHILMNEVNPAIEVFYQKITKSPDYEGLFVQTREALDMITHKTLLFVLDTHRIEITEAPELLRHPVTVIVIDHHRKSTDFIKDTALNYHESYASSTSELVTELLQYMCEDAKLTEIEAETLFAGIIIDTKNFAFKAGARTFEAAAYLRRYGADTVTVKQMLQNNLQNYIERSKVVVNAEIIYEKIAVSICNLKSRESQLIAAQASDELLSLTGIAAAFVLSASGGDILISGRSLGDVNVQVILEKLGGGGHFAEAGTKLKDTTMKNAVSILKSAIGDYMASSSDVKEQ